MGILGDMGLYVYLGGFFMSRMSLMGACKLVSRMMREDMKWMMCICWLGI